ncbi:MAG TPA: FKBP-type peptidyl-prolyl cis-trans isomerase [Candidatus Paceibacterota bacterium]|jgi:FKBP-type peptidyl-prolyl cis-trans isomerase|nr:FKBP-type peptidyl-prolyl cis-trans isomerase [Candidatus Paceibacterota bacterium]
MKYIISIVAIIAIIILAIHTHKKQTDTPATSPTTAPVSTGEEQTPQPSSSTTPATVTSITTNDGMTIETIREGSGPAITQGQQAEVDYTGMLVDGTVFDASAKHGSTFTFTLGAGDVIKGWDEGVLGMKVGETRKLTIPPELGYGSRDLGAIPPNSTLIFEVTLKGIH